MSDLKETALTKACEAVRKIIETVLAKQFSRVNLDDGADEFVAEMDEEILDALLDETDSLTDLILVWRLGEVDEPRTKPKGQEVLTT